MDEGRRVNALRRLAIWSGGVALLAATGIDTLAVAGRHLGLPLTGSIELMQAVILVSAAFGLLIATVDDAHARVRLVVDRLPRAWREAGDRCSDAATLLFFLALVAGSIWIAADLWNAHERSELLGVPWWMLRVFANACLLAAVGVLGRRVLQRRA